MVLTTVTFHRADLPTFQGINVSPSDRLPSVLKRPVGSTIAGISTRFKVRQTKSLELELKCLAFFLSLTCMIIRADR